MVTKKSNGKEQNSPYKLAQLDRYVDMNKIGKGVISINFKTTTFGRIAQLYYSLTTCELCSHRWSVAGNKLHSTQTPSEVLYLPYICQQPMFSHFLYKRAPCGPDLIWCRILYVASNKSKEEREIHTLTYQGWQLLLVFGTVWRYCFVYWAIRLKERCTIPIRMAAPDLFSK